MCHSRESTSTAMPSLGHQASGLAMNVLSSYSDGLNSGMGSPDVASSIRRPFWATTAAC